MSADTFIRVLREDSAVRNGFVEFVETGKTKLHAMMAAENEAVEIYRLQGEIRGIERIIRIVREALKTPASDSQSAKRVSQGA